MRRLRALLGRSLFVKVYLTLIACLIAVALVSAGLFRLGQDEEDEGWGARRDRFVASMLREGDDPATLKLVLDRFGDAFDADITLYDRGGRPVAATGDPLPRDVPRGPRARDDHDHDSDHDRDRIYVFDLPDGRVLAARADNPFGVGRQRPVLWLLAIALVVAAAAYPVVRHLTRRLERLRRGVETWGGVKLSARVPEDGRDEVAAVARSFNGAAERIERLVESNRALLANASHELRSPLARLRMAVDLYEKRPDEGSRLEIVRNLGELDALVEEILLASRLGHVERLEDTERFDLLAVAAEEAARHDLVVEGEPAQVRGDPRLIQRLVRNLIQNALRHGRPPVEVTVGTRGPLAWLSVRDHGDGVLEAEALRIFEPFYRPRGYGEAAGGWGLGLALVAQIAAHHGGSVRVERPATGGARFVVDLPLSTDGERSGRGPSRR